MTIGERRLLDLPRFATDRGAYAPGPGRMEALLRVLGDPHKGLPVVHIAGTNGKGSTASLAASIASASGRRVGLHTSPHLLTLRERMRVDGEPASEAWLDTAVRQLAEAIQEIGPSFFEATVALSLLYFAEQDVDLAVVEVGLGGRLDGTNVVEPVVSAVTHIGLDHTDLLGDTVEQIAREKAGIARPGVPLIHAVRGPAAEALEEEAERRGAPVETVRQSCHLSRRGEGIRLRTPAGVYGPVEVGLPGSHQAWNAAVAARAVETASGRLGWDLPDGAVTAGLAEVVQRSGLRGRGETWAGDGRVVLDVAHNADGWRAALAGAHPPADGRLWALVGVMRDKDAGTLADLLAVHGARVLAVGLDSDRALPAGDVADMLRQRGVVADAPRSAAEALAVFRRFAGPHDRMLVTGSHQTVAAVLREP